VLFLLDVAEFERAQAKSSQLSAQIAELTTKTSSAQPAIQIAHSNHRPAEGSVRLTSTSSAHAVRLVRAVSIDAGSRVHDLKSSEEKGREAQLLAMFGDIAAASAVPDDGSSPSSSSSTTPRGTGSPVLGTLSASPQRRRASGERVAGSKPSSSLAHAERPAAVVAAVAAAATAESSAAAQEAAESAESRRRAKRALAAKEILETEQRYVACLSSLVDNYKSALDESFATHMNQRKPGPGRGPQPIASGAQIKTMFSNVQAILNTNRVLLAQLAQRVGAWDDATSQLGDVFLRLSDFFKIYIEYANNYDAAQDVLDALLNESEAFLRFCEAMELVDQLDLGLEDLLIMPVQRLPRYTMLLETLLK
jgi:hypothetical protein